MSPSPATALGPLRQATAATCNVALLAIVASRLAALPPHEWESFIQASLPTQSVEATR